MYTCLPDANVMNVNNNVPYRFPSQFLYLVATTYNYAVLRFLGRKGIR